MKEKSDKASRVLLIVDDRDEVRLALARYFALHFTHIVTAGNPSEAEELLRTQHPDLLLCDYYLGSQEPTATMLIPRWRAEYKCLKRVAIMTGSRSSSIGPCPEADAIFEKPLNMALVTQFFMADLVD